MTTLDLDVPSDDKYKFIVVLGPSTSPDILFFGGKFSMWLEAANLLGHAFTFTQLVTRSINPIAALSNTNSGNALDELDAALQPFKSIICLGQEACGAVKKLELKDKTILSLPDPANIGSIKESANIILALRSFKTKL